MGLQTLDILIEGTRGHWHIEIMLLTHRVTRVLGQDIRGKLTQRNVESYCANTLPADLAFIEFISAEYLDLIWIRLSFRLIRGLRKAETLKRTTRLKVIAGIYLSMNSDNSVLQRVYRIITTRIRIIPQIASWSLNNLGIALQNSLI